MNYSINFYISLVIIFSIISGFVFKIKLFDYLYLFFIISISFRLNSIFIDALIFSFNSYEFSLLEKVISILESELIIYLPFWVIGNFLFYFVFNSIFFGFFQNRLKQIVLRLISFSVVYGILIWSFASLNPLFEYFQFNLEDYLVLVFGTISILYVVFMYFLYQYLKGIFKTKDYDKRAIYVILYIVFIRLIIYLFLLVFVYDKCHLYYSNNFHRSIHKMIYNLFPLQEKCYRSDPGYWNSLLNIE